MTVAFQEQLALIRELQEIDLNLHSLQASLDALPGQLKEVESAYTAVKGELEAAEAELAAVEKARRDDEAELAASVDHLRTREAKLYAIKTNKEYQAALKEVAESKRQNREREDRILQAMEKIETLTKNITQLRAETADKEGVWRTKLEEVKAEEAKIHEKMESDKSRRPDLAARIDKVTIRKYEFVRQRYAQASAGVIGGICQGCSTRIPPQLFNEMLRREELRACPSCQRLIYVIEAAEGDSESGSA
ncbi:MAG: C4-type zinc ribbon domain-containing protein [Pseudomonadota bacterium]